MEKDDPIFARIQRASRSLNKAADQATEYIRSVDTRLKKAGVGIEVVFTRPIECEDTTVTKQHYSEEIEVAAEIRTYLLYAKVDGTWGLAVAPETWIDPGGQLRDEFLSKDRRVLLIHADRQTRIKAVPHIPKLLDQIASELNKTAEQVNTTLTNQV